MAGAPPAAILVGIGVSPVVWSALVAFGLSVAAGWRLALDPQLAPQASVPHPKPPPPDQGRPSLVRWWYTLPTPSPVPPASGSQAKPREAGETSAASVAFGLPLTRWWRASPDKSAPPPASEPKRILQTAEASVAPVEKHGWSLFRWWNTLQQPSARRQDYTPSCGGSGAPRRDAPTSPETQPLPAATWMPTLSLVGVWWLPLAWALLLLETMSAPLHLWRRLVRRAVGGPDGQRDVPLSTDDDATATAAAAVAEQCADLKTDATATNGAPAVNEAEECAELKRQLTLRRCAVLAAEEKHSGAQATRLRMEGELGLLKQQRASLACRVNDLSKKCHEQREQIDAQKRRLAGIRHDMRQLGGGHAAADGGRARPLEAAARLARGPRERPFQEMPRAGRAD